MNTLHLLVSGDYWHEDFRDQFSRIKHPTTMVPVDRIESVADNDFDLVVLAKSGRNQIQQSFIDSIRSVMPNVPVVVLQGSWCEGENRSGQPLEGTNSVLWHQWESRFQKFCDQMSQGQTTDWHLPLTSTVADRVREFSADPNLIKKLSGTNVGISTLDKDSFDSLQELLKVYECCSKWVRSGSNKDSEDSGAVDAICINASRGVDELGPWLVQLKAKYKTAAFVVVAGFVRQQDIDMLAKHAIFHVIAKPFQADDFARVLVSSLDATQETVLPKPSILKGSQTTRQSKHQGS